MVENGSIDTTNQINNITSETQKIMNILLKKNNKNYLIIFGIDKAKDILIIIIHQSCNFYISRYNIEDFKNINIIKNYTNFGLSQCVEILFNLLEEKKELIKIEEEEDLRIKISLDIEMSVVGMKMNLPVERIELILTSNSNEISKEIKNYFVWQSSLKLFKENEELKKIKIEQENKINQMNQEIHVLKKSLEDVKYSEYIIKDYDLASDGLRKSKIFGADNNINNLDFIKKKLSLLQKDKKIEFKMLYSAKTNGEKGSNFHECCDYHHNTLILIQTELNNIFGGFASKIWNTMDMGRKKDMKSFIFSVNFQKIYNPKLESKYHLYCSEEDGPCFYAFSVENFCLQNGGYCDEIHKCNYDSFESEYELNNGIKNFKIKELEVYEVLFI